MLNTVEHDQPVSVGLQRALFVASDIDAGVDKGSPCVQVTSILPLYSNTTTKADDIWVPL